MKKHVVNLPFLETGVYSAEGNRLLIDVDKQKGVNSRDVGETLVKRLSDTVSAGDLDSAILLTSSLRKDADYKLTVIEKDGSISNMCGNGVRAVAAFMNDKYGLAEVKLETAAGEIVIGRKENNGLYSARLSEVKELNGDQEDFKNLVGDEVLRMSEPFNFVVSEAKKIDGANIISVSHILREPHMVVSMPKVKNKHHLALMAKKLMGLTTPAGNKVFPVGININYVVNKFPEMFIVTYERGVNDFTGSCGTGSICSAKQILGSNSGELNIKALSGELKVGYDGKHYKITGHVRRLGN